MRLSCCSSFPFPLALFAILRLAIGSELPPPAIVGLACGIGLGAERRRLRILAPARPARGIGLIDAAWGVLVPRLIDGALSAKEAALLGGLGQVSPGGRHPHRGSRSRSRGAQANFERVNDPKYLPIQRPCFICKPRMPAPSGQDPMPVPPEADTSLSGGQRSFALPIHTWLSWAPAGEAAPSHGASAHDASGQPMFAAGARSGRPAQLTQAYDGLSATLDIKNADLLIQMRYLSSFKAGKPWEKCGKAMTVSDLAGANSRQDRPSRCMSYRCMPCFSTTSAQHSWPDYIRRCV